VGVNTGQTTRLHDPRIPSKEDIEQLAFDSHLVYSVLTLARTHQLTWEDTLTLLVLALHQENDTLRRELISQFQKTGPSAVITLKDLGHAEHCAIIRSKGLRCTCGRIETQDDICRKIGI
jgi:hypothetical protein